MTLVEIEDKETYFNENYCGPEKTPKLTEKRRCIHCNQIITVGDYKVEFSQGREWIVCPNAPSCNGTIIDWFPVR